MALKLDKDKYTAVLVDIDKVKPNGYNPNRMDEFTFTALRAGIERQGFLGAVLVRKDSNEIIDGEHRWKAAKELGAKKIPVIYLDVTDDEAKRLTIGMNKKRGEFDYAALTAVLATMDIPGGEEGRQDYSLDLGFDERLLQRLLPALEADALGTAVRGPSAPAGVEPPRGMSARINVGNALPAEGDSPTFLCQVGWPDREAARSFMVAIGAPVAFPPEGYSVMVDGTSLRNPDAPRGKA